MLHRPKKENKQTHSISLLRSSGQRKKNINIKNALPPAPFTPTSSVKPSCSRYWFVAKPFPFPFTPVSGGGPQEQKPLDTQISSTVKSTRGKTAIPPQLSPEDPPRGVTTSKAKKCFGGALVNPASMQTSPPVESTGGTLELPERPHRVGRKMWPKKTQSVSNQRESCGMEKKDSTPHPELRAEMSVCASGKRAHKIYIYGQSVCLPFLERKNGAGRRPMWHWHWHQHTVGFCTFHTNRMQSLLVRRAFPPKNHSLQPQTVPWTHTHKFFSGLCPFPDHKSRPLPVGPVWCSHSSIFHNLMWHFDYSMGFNVFYGSSLDPDRLARTGEKVQLCRFCLANKWAKILVSLFFCFFWPNVLGKEVPLVAMIIA